MRPRFLLPAALLLLPLLPGCALGANFSPLTPLERALNGTFEGVGSGITGRVPYRVVLDYQQATGRVAGVVTNLESRKAYTASGSFTWGGQSGTLELNLFENGNQHRGNLHAQMTPERITGTLRTVLLGRELFAYGLTLNRVGPDVTPAPTTLTPTMPGVTPPSAP